MIEGIVQFTGPIGPTSSGDTFPTHIDTYGKGGLRTVADETERNSIPYLRRSINMVVATQSDGSYWKLVTNPSGNTTTNSDWGLFPNTPFSGGDYWTSGSTGNYSIKAKNDTGLDATGDYSVAEGAYTKALGNFSHAEGAYTIASGVSSHAEGYYSTAIAQYSHVGGSYNLLISGATNSAILGGTGITGTSADTMYVGYLNIKDLGGGTSVNNLGIDASGFVVVGASGSSENKYVKTTGFTGSVLTTITHGLGTEDIIAQIWDSTKQLVSGTVQINGGNPTNAVDITLSVTGTYKIVIMA